MPAETLPTGKISFDGKKEGSPPHVASHDEVNAASGAAAAASSSSSKKKDLANLLHETKAIDIPVANHNVVEVEAHLTPYESAKILWKAGILGAPVWDKDKHTYVGFFDMRDLISTVLVAPRKNSNSAGTDANWLADNLTTSYLAARNPFVALNSTTASLWDVCQELGKNDIHRVPLVDPTTQRCVRIISQSAVVKFLAQHVDATIFPALSQTLNEANFPYRKQVIQASDTYTARQVFTLMERHRLLGIAIVDEETGKHVGNTSAVDIKLAIRVDDEEQEDGGNSETVLQGADMDMDILSYLAAVRQERTFVQRMYHAHDPYPCAHVRESSCTVGHALRMLAKTGFHRVFVVDDTYGRPVGVISVTDMIQFVITQIPQQK